MVISPNTAASVVRSFTKPAIAVLLGVMVGFVASSILSALLPNSWRLAIESELFLKPHEIIYFSSIVVAVAAGLVCMRVNSSTAEDPLPKVRRLRYILWWAEFDTLRFQLAMERLEREGYQLEAVIPPGFPAPQRICLEFCRTPNPRSSFVSYYPIAGCEVIQWVDDRPLGDRYCFCRLVPKTKIDKDLAKQGVQKRTEPQNSASMPNRLD